MFITLVNPLKNGIKQSVKVLSEAFIDLTKKRCYWVVFYDYNEVRNSTPIE